MSKSIPPTGEPAAPASTSTATATPTSPATSTYATEYYGTPVWVHAASIAASVLGPIGLMLPPRRMSVRSLVLVAGTCIGTSQLAYDYTGTSLFARFGSRAQGVLDESNADLPPAALRRQAAMRAEKERRAAAAAAALHAGQSGSAGADAAASDAEKSRLQKLWMGQEKENWVEERARRERDTLESGGSYWDLIMTQIGEAVEEFLPKSKEQKEEDEKKK
ncbi:rhomboid family membrane protein [Ophiostoma piceae UAMH 11346]|uniref:Rhomboid family membrane protein n=1 Tax=Ophiostoma piceae (strain UAMH 11346) TaxID=1262450 RepID=S3BU43_OPHP1|nr:rhomboid family membrane protein [Ophiostoma piceae UAMH 11346]